QLIKEEAMRCKWFFVAVSMLLAGVLTAAQSNSPQGQTTALKPDDLALGKKIFNGQCALCHGIEATGGRGPALNLPKLQRATTDDAMFKIIKEGIEGSEMPGAWQLTDREIRLVASYVRSLGRIEPVSLSGNASRGKEIFETKGNCSACHIVFGQG